MQVYSLKLYPEAAQREVSVHLQTVKLSNVIQEV